MLMKLNIVSQMWMTGITERVAVGLIETDSISSVTYWSYTDGLHNSGIRNSVN